MDFFICAGLFTLALFGIGFDTENTEILFRNGFDGEGLIGE